MYNAEMQEGHAFHKKNLIFMTHLRRSACRAQRLSTELVSTTFLFGHGSNSWTLTCMKEVLVALNLLGFGLTLICCGERSQSPCGTGLVEAYVIGFDQCRAGLETNMGKGFLLATAKGDTVMTYNLPDSIISFPKDLFTNWWLSAFFPDAAQLQYRIAVRYRPALPHELVSAACPGYVIFYPVTAKARQVVLVCVGAN